jgi:alginate O-acetyltransferase complex protein AlgJ
VEADYIKKIILEEKDASQTDASTDLFGDEDIPVTLVGTSYSANSKWGFADFLKENFGTDVLNAADEGMGPFETMKKYLNDGAFKKTPPKLVVWEIPERYLPVKYDLDIKGVN